MRPELEGLLNQYDRLQETPTGPEHTRQEALYRSHLEETAQRLKIDPEMLHKLLRQYWLRWVRANLPPGFPKKLAGS